MSWLSRPFARRQCPRGRCSRSAQTRRRESLGSHRDWARADGPLVEGGIVEARAGYGTVYRWLIQRLEPDRALELVVKPAGLDDHRRLRVTPSDTGSRVRHAFEISGPIAGITRPFLVDRYLRKLGAEVTAVIAMASDPTRAGEAAAPDRQVSPPERSLARRGQAAPRRSRKAAQLICRVVRSGPRQRC
jgi:hypothetical protein